MNCPPEFLGLFVARATYFGPLHTDVLTVEELLELDRTALETREELAARLVPGEIVASYAILGFYATRAEASAALDWVRAWRAGS